jgi:hypothetical protein
LGTPESVQATLKTALLRVMDGSTAIQETTFPEFMEQAGFDNTVRHGPELINFLNENDQKLGETLTDPRFRVVNRDRYSPLVFPAILGCLIAATGLVGALSVREDGPLAGLRRLARAPRAGWIGVGLVVAMIGLFCLTAETVGFVLAMALMVAAPGVWLGGGWPRSVLVACVGALIFYQVFAHGLGVPLPQGWIGW